MGTSAGDRRCGSAYCVMKRGFHERRWPRDRQLSKSGLLDYFFIVPLTAFPVRIADIELPVIRQCDWQASMRARPAGGVSRLNHQMA
jgi:hypothetical protein